MRTEYKFHEDLNDKCKGCENHLWYAEYKEYNCEFHWCRDNSHYKEYEFKPKEGKNGKFD